MKKCLQISPLIIFLIVFSFLLSCGTEDSSAFWIWSPKSKKFENPKYAVKDTPEEQYDWAMTFFNARDYEKAAQEFVRLCQAYKDSDVAPEAQYYAGRSYEEIGKHWFAYENYQKTLDNYPYTKRQEELIEREFNIAEIFRQKGAPRLMDLELNLSLEKAVTIYGKIVSNSTFGPYADKALFNMAECYRRLRKYTEAMDSYSRLLTDYPNSPLLAEAKFQLAETTYEASLDPEYDQESTEAAIERFEKISQTATVSEVKSQADEVLDVLRERKAESILKVAQFYEKAGKRASALFYYQEIVRDYPETKTAALADKRIAVIQNKIKK